MGDTRASAAPRAAGAVGTALLALGAVGVAFWGIGWLLGTAGKAVGLR